MTFWLVEAGEIIGILLCWQIGAASSDRLDATSPSTATTLSCAISFRTIVAGWPACDWSSSVISFSFFPSTPPAALISSNASCVPLCEDWPKLALPPVSEANSPILISSCASTAEARRVSAREKMSGRFIAAEAKDRARAIQRAIYGPDGRSGMVWSDRKNSFACGTNCVWMVHCRNRSLHLVTH